MSDEDSSLDEKRVFEGRRGRTLAFVACGLGLARVAVSDDQIGRFGLIHREPVRDVAVASDGRLVIATDETVHVGSTDEFDEAVATRTDFGPAVAVSVADTPVAADAGAPVAAVAGAPVASDADGRVARFEDGGWRTIGTVPTPVTAMDGPLIATADDVVRIEGDALVSLGRPGHRDDRGAAVADVAAGGTFAATGEGLYRHADGEWSLEAAGAATAVATGLPEGRADRQPAVAVVDGAVRERDPDGWTVADCPATDVVDVAAGRSSSAVTADGTVLVDPPTAKDGAAGWSARSLGLTDVAALAVLESAE